ncbi:MAG: Ig-like domain-containing protein, partial [Silicimonas sp.]|nr:Ig-like domain-containing protein [Silicimonas sp.]
MPVSILNPIATLALDLRLSNLPVNGDFSDTTGLSFIGGRAPGNPMGWQVTGGDVFTDGSATNLRLGDDGAAVTDFGVLTDDALVFVTLTTPGLDQSTVTYTDGGQPVTGDVALYADLMIGSEVIATRAFALDAAGSEGWTATLDLTGADLSAHTIGETGISLRIRNESGTEIAIDNVASDEAVSTRVRLTGSVTLSAAPAVGTAVSVENIAVTEPYAVVDAADLAPYLTATLVGDRVDWVLDAPRALVEELAEGDTLDLGFDVQVTEPAETPQTASVTVTLTGVNDAPLAQDGTGALDEDGTLSGTLLATDPDESDSFTFALRSAPAKGVVTIDGATGDYTYTPNAHAVGDDSFTFVVRDAGGAETLGTVTLTIAAENDVPALVGGAVSPQSYELLKDGDYAFYLADFLFDDPDGDKADMVLTISGHDGKGDLVIDADFLTANALMFDAAAGTLTGSQQGIKNALTSIGKIAYRDSSGDDVTLSFAIRDNGSTEGAEESLDLGQISLTIVTNPEAQDASVEGVEDVVLQGQLVAIEEDGDPVTFALRAGGEPKFGTVTVTASGAYTYTPKADYYGSDSFEFTVTDGNTTSIGTVTISIANLADTPVAGDELVLVQMDGSRKGLLDGVSTGDDPVVFALAEGGAPQNGTLTLLEDGRYTYTPDAGFSGFDSFTFGATAAGLTNFATGRIYVFADADTPVVGDLVLSTIGTDGTRTGVIDAVDQSDDVLTFSVAEGDGPSDGTLVMGADGRFTFTPADGQSGLVEFTVTVSDGAHEATRLVSFSVDGALDGDGRLVGTVEADLLQGTDGADQIRLGAGDVVRAGEGDDLVLVAGDGTGAVIDGGTGKDQVRVEAGSGVADLTGSSFTGVEELVGNGAGLRFDGELDLSGVALVTGTGDINGGDGDDTLHGSMLGEVFDGGAGINRFVVSGVLADFTVVVTGPNAAEITNGQGLIDRVSNVAEIVFDDYTYVLDGANPAPVVRDDAVAVDAGTDATIAAATLLANDEDVEGESLTITSVTGNEDLAVTLDGSTITVTPSDEFDALAQGESADVSFDYTVTDSDGSSASASVTVTVDGVNDAPVAGADEAETASYTKLTGNVLGNDSDVDAGATLSVTALDGGAAIRQWFTGVSDLGAKLRIDPDGSYHYDPRGIFADLAEGETVVDTFRYTVSDEFGATSTETVSISVTGEAKPELGDYEYADHARAGSVISEADGLLAEAVAQAGGQVTAVAGGTAVEIHELVDGAVEIRQAFAVAGSDGGRFEIDADGAIRFDPGRDFDDLKEDQTRTTTFDFTVTQGNGRTFTGTSKVTVAASDLAPKIETTLSEPLAPTMSATTVSGSFDQQGGIDVISELFGRLDDAVPFDLDALLDFDVIDIDSLVKVSFSPDTGIDITLSDNSVNPDALITGLGEKLDPAADFVSDVVQSAYALPLQPVYFGPNFDIEFGMQAKLGWDIDLPSLGKTAVFQPVELDLLLPDAPVEAGQSFFINTNNMKSLAPTTAVQTVGLGDFKLDASYGVTHAKLADVGLVFGTHNFLNLKLDDVFDGGIYLNSEFDLLELTGSSDQASFDSSISLSMRDILDGVLTLDFGQFVGLVQDFAADPGSKTAQALGGYVMDALAVVAENAAVRIDLGNGVEVKPSDLVAMVDRIPFNEFDGRNEFGEGVFLLEDADGTEVAFTGAALIDALDNSDVSSALDEIKTMLTEGF